MRDRWRALGVLAAALFAVNVVARLIIRFGFEGDDTAADRVSLAMFLVIGLILAGLVFRWGAATAGRRWGGDVAAAVGVALAADRPGRAAAGRAQPVRRRAGHFFAQIWLYLRGRRRRGARRLPDPHRAGPRLPLPAAQAVRRDQDREAPPRRPPLTTPIARRSWSCGARRGRFVAVRSHHNPKIDGGGRALPSFVRGRCGSGSCGGW